jgi:hypothetical protein
LSLTGHQKVIKRSLVSYPLNIKCKALYKNSKAKTPIQKTLLKEGRKMKTQDYYVECDEIGYCVVGTQGTVATFAVLDDAYNAMREFQTKTFPENWQKEPPATRRAKQLYYGTAA